MRNVWRGIAVASFGLCTIGLAAQDRSTDPQSSPITVVGCLQQGEQTGSPAGTGLGTSVPPQAADAAANLNEPVGFLLTDAAPVTRPTGAAGRTAGSPTGTVGRADRKRSRDNKTTYALDGDATELVEHRGHRIEVTGTLAPPISSGAGTGRPNDPAFETGVQRLRVTSIKMIATECRN